MKVSLPTLFVQTLACALFAVIPMTLTGCDNKEKVLDVEAPGVDIEVDKDRDSGAVDIEVDKKPSADEN